jgi:hypothetical protein
MKNKLMAIGILVLLSLFGYGISYGTSFYQKVNTVKEAEIETNTTANTDEDIVEVISDNSEAVEGTCPECEEEEVLGDNDSTTDICESVLNEEVTTPVFIDASGDVDYKDGSPSGDYVRKDADITIVEIKVPAVLLAGSYQVEDSNQLISMDSAANKAAGSNFSESSGRQLLSPSSGEEYDDMIDSAVYKEPFGSETEMKYAQTEEDGPVAKIDVGTTTCSICEKLQDSNYNPDKANGIASVFNDTLSIPGGQTEAPQNEEEYLTIDSGIVEELPEAGEEVACARNPNALTKIASLFKSISSSIFNRCNMEDENGDLLYPDECIRVEDIVIRTNSFFGDYESCKEEGKCTNTFLSRRSLVMSSPDTASSFDENFLVTTDCKVDIDGKEYVVKCLWDVSYIAYEYYHQWQERNPGKEFPEWNVYWTAIEEDLTKRASTRLQAS